MLQNLLLTCNDIRDVSPYSLGTNVVALGPNNNNNHHHMFQHILLGMCGTSPSSGACIAAISKASSLFREACFAIYPLLLMLFVPCSCFKHKATALTSHTAISITWDTLQNR